MVGKIFTKYGKKEKHVGLEFTWATGGFQRLAETFKLNTLVFPE